METVRTYLYHLIGTGLTSEILGLVSYYLSLVLDSVGITEKATKNKINVGESVSSFFVWKAC